MKRFLWLLLLLCPYVSEARQKLVLKVGDKVPNVTLANMLNYKSTKAKLYDFKNKLVLLDLWATTCGACIGELKMLDSMQRCYPRQLSVLGINSLYDTKERFDNLVKRINLKVNVPMVLGNKTLQEMFPHYSVPHFVWLDSSFKVIAITDGAQVTDMRISQHLSGVTLTFEEEEIRPDFDFEKPLFKDGNAGDGSQVFGRSTFANRIPGMGSMNFPITDSLGRITRWVLINQTVEDLLIRAYRYFPLVQTFKWEGIPISGQFSWELITPPIPKEEALVLLQQDIARHLKLSAEVSTGDSPVLFIHHLPN